jgi:hypothetical protein
MAPLRAFAPWREMGFLIQATVLAKAQRRKGRKGKTTAMAPLDSQQPLVRPLTIQATDGLKSVPLLIVLMVSEQIAQQFRGR